PRTRPTPCCAARPSSTARAPARPATRSRPTRRWSGPRSRGSRRARPSASASPATRARRPRWRRTCASRCSSRTDTSCPASASPPPGARSCPTTTGSCSRPRRSTTSSPIWRACTEGAMTYRSQRVAYGWFAAALLLFALQIAFGFLTLAKSLGPDPLLNVMHFATTKAIHTNLLLVWLLSGFMGAAFYLVPEESRTELHSERLAWIQLALWLAIGVVTLVGYLFGITEGRKFLEM